MANERIQRRVERLLDRIDTAEASDDWQEVVNLARDVLAVDEENREALAYLQTAERNLVSSSEAGTELTNAEHLTPSVAPFVDSTQPTSFSDGRYQVKRFLGEDGKKMVYLAQDTLLDRDVAFALIKTDGLNDQTLAVASTPIQAAGIVGVSDVVDRAVKLSEPGSLQEGWLRTRQVTGNHVERSIETLKAAHQIADDHGNLALRARVYGHFTRLYSWDDNPETAIEHAKKSEGIAREADEPLSEGMATGYIEHSYLALERADEALACAQSAIEISEKIRDNDILARGMLAQHMVGMLKGDWELARTAAGAAAPLFTGRHYNYYNSLELAYRGDSDQAINQLIDALERVAAPISGIERGKIPISSAIVAAVRTNESFEPLKIVESALNKVIDSGLRPIFENAATAVLGLVVSVRNEKDRASEIYQKILSRSARADAPSSLSLDRALGLLAQTMGKLNDAERHFEEAIAFCRKAGYRPELAWSLHDYADMLLQRISPGDSKKATAMLDEALQISTDLGMQPLMERVLSKRDILKA